jgi:redox-sensitive bicupin YhaK (pirin superfamily)
MIKVRPARERGRTRTDWLESHHTFSFNRYYDPNYSGFRDLLVLNEDYVAPGRGFGTHSHDNMEILSYVVEGALEHRDSTGASGTLRPNELQRMTAGTGVRHSEFNPSASEKTHFLQIWILPEREGLSPGYEQRAFPETERRGRLRLLVSPDGREGSVTIHQNVKVYDALLASGDKLTYDLEKDHYAWVQVVKGAVALSGSPLGSGDGAAVSHETSIELSASEDAEILLFDLV